MDANYGALNHQQAEKTIKEQITLTYLICWNKTNKISLLLKQGPDKIDDYNLNALFVI